MKNQPPVPVPYIMVHINSDTSVENPPNAMSQDNITVTLNVGGVKHETYVSTLKRLPGTKLANPEELALHFRPEMGDHFFDRHPLIFAAILNYYRTGLLHVPQDMCAAVVHSELEYWGIDEVNMEDCCWSGYSAQKDTDKLLTKFGIDKNSQQTTRKASPQPAKTKLGRFRAAVWEALEDPFSSTPAKVYTVVSILVTLVSIFTFCAATHPAFSGKLTLKDYANVYSVSPETIVRDWKGTNYYNDYAQHQYDYDNDDNNDDNSAAYDDQDGSGTDAIDSTTDAARLNDTDTAEPAQQDTQTPPPFSGDSDIDDDDIPDIDDDDIPDRKKRSTYGNTIRFHLNQILKLKELKRKRPKRSVSDTTTPASTTTNRTVHFRINPAFRAPNRGLVITDYICYGYFTVEFLMRLVFCPNKLHFFTTWVTWLDLACILPYYIEIILDSINKAERYQESLIDALTALRIFRIFRILRIFRFNTGLRVLAFTLRSSLKEMFVMVLFLSTAVLFFGSLIYYADRSSGTFKTLPDAAWWAIVTMTTVGYGDISPKSIIGRCIGSICAICGVLVIGFTVPVIVNNFMTFYAFVNANRMNAMKLKTPTDSHLNKIYPTPVIDPMNRGCDIKNVDTS